MNNITRGQLWSLLLINDVFALFCLNGGISLVTLAGFAVGMIIQMICTVPVMRIYRRGKSLENCGKTAEWAVLAGVVLWGGLLFSMLWSACGMVSVPFEDIGEWSRLIMAFTIAAVCVYISSSGIKAAARSATVAAAIGAVCLVTAAVSALIKSDMSNLKTAAQSGIAAEIVKGMAVGGGISSAVLLAGFVKGGKSGLFGYFIGRLAVTSVVLFTGVLVSGGIMEITEFPIVTAAQLAQPFSSQRVDALFLIVFTVFAVYSLAVQGAAADFLLDEVCPRFRKYRCTAMLALMAAVGAAFQGKAHYGAVFAAICTVIPLFTAACYRLKKVNR